VRCFLKCVLCFELFFICLKENEFLILKTKKVFSKLLSNDAQIFLAS
jgi:hypothetical protein